MFYFTQSVKEGLPTQACIVPAIEDIGSTLQNLGAILIVTGLLFLLMIFMTFPICCYNSEDEQTEADADEQKKKEQERAEREAKYKDNGAEGQANQMA